MKWDKKLEHNYLGIVQYTVEGTTKAHAYYYIKQATGFYHGYVVGRYTFGKTIDYREWFSTLAEARAFAKEIDESTLVIVEVRA